MKRIPRRVSALAAGCALLTVLGASGPFAGPGTATPPAHMSSGPSGTLDATFGTAGLVLTPEPIDVYAVQAQLDGKIVAVGRTNTNQWGIARFNIDGSADTAFGSSGVVLLFGSTNDHATDLAIDHVSGKIYVTGWTTFPSDPARFTLVRLLPGGSLDASFDGDGIAQVQIERGSMSNGLALQADGKILVSGFAALRKSNCFALARFNPDGSLDDQGFGAPAKKNKPLPTKGYVVFDYDARHNDQTNDGVIAIQDDGKILLGGWTLYQTAQPNYIIARFNGSDGSLDTSFGSNGVVDQSFAGLDMVQLRGLEVYDNRIYASGRGCPTWPADFDTLLARYDLNGTLDPSFGSGGYVLSGHPGEDNGSGLAIQPDGKIVIAANTVTGTVADTVAFRFNPDGTLDAGFDGDGMSVLAGTSNSAARAVCLDPLGDIFLAGWATGQGVIAKYNR